jgi:hypothetical protein
LAPAIGPISEFVLFQDVQPVFHQFVVVRLIACGAAQFRDTGALREFDPYLGDEDTFKVKTNELHGKTPLSSGAGRREGAILPSPNCFRPRNGKPKLAHKPFLSQRTVGNHITMTRINRNTGKGPNGNQET